jgi:hypothetical protein
MNCNEFIFRYVPGNSEISAVQHLIDKYLSAPFERLQNFISGKTSLDKEDVLRNLRQIYKVVFGCSEVSRVHQDRAQLPCDAG